MSVVTRNLRIFIMERKPKDIGEMSILAEQYLVGLRRYTNVFDESKINRIR